jgi:SOS-response transcriptional repressor LexA
VAILNGEFLVRRLQMQAHSVTLLPENKKYGAIHVEHLEDYRTWGVVTYVIHGL